MADNSEALFNWNEAIKETFTEISQQLVNYAPQIIGAAIILLIGWGVAHALALSTRKLVQGLDTLFTRVTKADSDNRERIKHSYAIIISKVVYWIIIIFSLAVGANILGWDLFSGWMESVFDYLPGLITGLIIILGGFLLSNLAKAGIISAAHKAGIHQSVVMAKVIKIAIIFSSIIIGVEQVGLNIDFLSNIIVAVITIILAGGVLAFSLGAKNLVSNVIGAQYIRRHCKVGDILTIGNTKGEILEVSQASIILKTDDGKAIIPAKYFHEQVSNISSQQ